MPKKDPRVDAYIAKSADFAKPILRELRAAVHAGCPQVEETVRWGMPSFSYKGILCGMAAFKAHCAFFLWQGRTVVAAAKADAMGNFGRITALSDLPSRSALAGYVKKAARLKDEKEKSPRKAPKRPVRPPLPVPADLRTALARNKRAKATFDGFPPSHRRDYIEWITEAKREETRARRLKTAIAMLAEGKSRNWKYS